MWMMSWMIILTPRRAGVAKKEHRCEVQGVMLYFTLSTQLSDNDDNGKMSGVSTLSSLLLLLRSSARRRLLEAVLVNNGEGHDIHDVVVVDDDDESFVIRRC
jgi:hypothetical protein